MGDDVCLFAVFVPSKLLKMSDVILGVVVWDRNARFVAIVV
jgi:hypothetical protein